jgi:hypothetical protein
LVEPEHRLVARQLAQEWEAKLTAQRQLQEEYERFVQAQPRSLSAAERTAIVQLAHNIPALWHAPTTTLAERKEMVRQIIRRVMVAGEGTSERLQITIEWVGGGTTAGVITRPIQTASRFPFRWRGMKPTVSGTSQLGAPPRLHSAQEEALDTSEPRYANPRGYANPIQSAYVRTGVNKIMTRFVAVEVSMCSRKEISSISRCSKSCTTSNKCTSDRIIRLSSVITTVSPGRT